ncbi:MAG: hypothetical protein IPO60_13610 [Flavobacteriales bacterium]|nr:hypothetical protein [Flavobacteriales bacterium]MBK9599316.1 hypothetical protein [Flavobacteriales bacterium]
MKKRKVEKEKAFDYAKFEQEAIQGLTEGKGLIGEHGVLTGMIGRLLSAAFEGGDGRAFGPGEEAEQ